MKLNTIKEAIADIKAGKMVIVVDNEDRENEGDFIIASEKAKLKGPIGVNQSTLIPKADLNSFDSSMVVS